VYYQPAFYLTSTADKVFLSPNISSVPTANYEKSYKQIKQKGLLNLIRLIYWQSINLKRQKFFKKNY